MIFHQHWNFWKHSFCSLPNVDDHFHSMFGLHYYWICLWHCNEHNGRIFLHVRVPIFWQLKISILMQDRVLAPALKLSGLQWEVGVPIHQCCVHEKPEKKVEKRCNKTKISILNCFNVILVIRQFTISSIKETWAWALVNFRCRKFLIFNQKSLFFQNLFFCVKIQQHGCEKRNIVCFHEKTW